MNNDHENHGTIVLDLGDESARPAAGPAVVLDGESGATIVNEDADTGDQLPARVVHNDDGSITLPLLHPRTLTIRSAKNGDRLVTYNELKFNRMNGADMNAIAAADKAAQIPTMFARSTRTSPAVMKALHDVMDAEDIADGAQVVLHFFGSGRSRSTKS